MSESFQITLKYFRWAAAIFVVAYTSYIMIDDYVLFEYINNMPDLTLFLSFQILYFLVCFMSFSCCYIILAVTTLVLYGQVKKKMASQSI